MDNSKKYISLLSTLVIIILLNLNLFAQTEEEKRAMYVFSIGYGVTWEDADKIDKYTIGVFSSINEFNAFENLAKSVTIQGKPVEVFRYTKHEDIKPHHIVYVTKSENEFLGFIFEKFKCKNVLIISDRSKEPQFSVINFRNLEKDAQKFDINKKHADCKKLILSQRLMKLGGDREILQLIFTETKKRLIKYEKSLKEKDAEIIELKKEIKELKKKLSEK